MALLWRWRKIVVEVWWRWGLIPAVDRQWRKRFRTEGSSWRRQVDWRRFVVPM